MGYNYSVGRIIKIKLTEKEKRESGEYDDFEEYLYTLEEKYDFKASDCHWMVTERLKETSYGFKKD